MGQSSETLPVQEGKIMFWKRQRVLLFELDHAREREIIFSFVWE